MVKVELRIALGSMGAFPPSLHRKLLKTDYEFPTRLVEGDIVDINVIVKNADWGNSALEVIQCFFTKNGRSIKQIATLSLTKVRR